MSALQQMQSPLGNTSPLSSRPRSKEVTRFDANEELLSKNLPSNETALGTLRRLRTNNRQFMVILTGPDSDAINAQEFLQTVQQEIAVLNLAHHGAIAQIPRPQVVEQIEAPELRWLREHRQDIARLAGQWLLIAGNQLLANSPNFGEIKAAIAQHNVRSPFTYYVPTEDESLFTLL